MSNGAAVSYQIQVTRTGEGATQAVNDFKAVSAAAAQSAAAINQNTPAVNNAAAASAAAGKQFAVFKGTLTLVAGQAFPQLTASVMVAKNAVDGLRASGAALSLGVGTISAGIIGLTAALVTASFAWQQYVAEKQAAASATALAEQGDLGREILTAEINRLEKEQEITKDMARRLRNSTGDRAGNKSVSEFLRYRQEGNANDRIQELRLIQQLEDAESRLKNPQQFSAPEEAKTRALRQNVEFIKLYNELQAEGLITAQEADRAKTEADIGMYNRMADIKAQLTEMQIMGQEITQQFASGFSHAFVEMVQGTKSAKEAFGDFAASFMAQIAEMIMAQIVLNAIAGTSWGKAVGMKPAARGGMFPQMMAAGGMAGVSSVSSATYFPKFNVVAGEAGSEMLTVLARPRMMEVGGMQAVVGNAGPNRLAITNAEQLAQRGGAGGTIVIQVQGTPDFEARVVQNSVKGAVVQVANDMRQDTPIARGVKGLTA